MTNYDHVTDERIRNLLTGAVVDEIELNYAMYESVVAIFRDWCSMEVDDDTLTARRNAMEVVYDAKTVEEKLNALRRFWSI